MCVDWISATEMLDPGDEEPPAGCRSASNKPIACSCGIGQLLTVGVSHSFVDFADRNPSFWMIFLDVLPVGTVPDDRPIVHSLSIYRKAIRPV